MDARQILEEQLPRLLVQSPAQAQQVGAVFLLVLTGERGGRWTLDLRSNPPSVRPGEGVPPDATLTLEAGDFEAIVADPSKGYELFFQGRLQVNGDPALAGRLPALLSLFQGQP